MSNDIDEGTVHDYGMLTETEDQDGRSIDDRAVDFMDTSYSIVTGIYAPFMECF
ncbi:hypothetical protein [Geosporobacter ferrireducens]|uniref:hypothetical protein n=1 Tax=Geosporobacter ferrireducens TaxID=1424294 RepID=UPI0012EABE90|nr:hypothetical protein [Geosporobacter ferrireducens]